MKTATLLCALISICYSSFGQKFSQITSNPQATTAILFTKDPNTLGIAGNPNFNTDWKQGSVTTSNGDQVDLESMQFNLFLGKILFLQNGSPYTLPDALNIQEFTIGNSTFIYTKFNRTNSKDFLQVLSSGNSVSLLKRYECNIIKGKPTSGMILATPDKYTVSSDYFVKLPDGTVDKIRAKKEDVLEIMVDKSLEINDYVKKNKLKFKNENDLIKVFYYYNSLD